MGREKGTREVFQGPLTCSLTWRPSPAVGCWSGHSESPWVPRASVEFPLLQSLSQVDTAVTLARLPSPSSGHQQHPLSSSRGRSPGEAAQPALGSAQSPAVPGLPHSQPAAWAILACPGKPPAQLPGTAACTAPRPNILELSVPAKGSAGRMLCAQESILPSPHSRGKLVTRLAGFLLGRRDPPPTASPELEKGWGKEKTNEFSTPICF